jgi:DNA-directed RNA polymerase specialized sigma24 family protein
MTSEQDLDRVLVDAVLRLGDERAFNTLFERHSPALSGFVGRIGGDRGLDCDDIVQETWIRAFRALRRFWY